MGSTRFRGGGPRRTQRIGGWAAPLAAAAIVLAGLAIGSTAAGASPSGNGSPADAPGCAPGQVQQAGVPPMGAPVATVTAGSAAVAIDGREYTPSGPGSLAHLVIVNRCSLAVRAYGFDDHGQTVAAIRDHLAGLDAGSIVILAMPDGLGLSYSQLKDLNDDVLAKVGAPALTIDQAENAFSVVGVRGWQSGAAFRNVGGTVDDVEGDVSGYLRLNPVTERYDFVLADYVPFDTAVPASAGRSTIQVGGASYTQTLPAGSSAGFHVLALDGKSLTPLLDRAMPTNTTGGPPGPTPADLSDQQALAATLQTLAATDELVMVQSIGNPGGLKRTPAWASAANQLVKLGGTSAVFNGLDGTGGYSLVGSVGMTVPPAEVGQSLTKEPARLEGLLARTQSSGFAPLAADPLGTVNVGLVQLAYQSPTPFPAFGTEGQRKAETYIGTKVMKVCPADAKSCDVRSQYYENYRASWSTIQNQLLDLKDRCPDGPGFTSADCQAVRGQLYTEVSDLTRVQHYLGELQKPFGTAQVAALVDLKNVDREIQKSVAPPPEGVTTSQAFEIMALVMKLGAIAPPPASNVAAGLSATFSIVAYFTRSSGSSNLIGPRITEKADQLGTDAFNRYQVASDQLDSIGRIVASDYGKLTTMAANVDSNEGWRLPPTLGAATDQIRKASVRWFYQELLPVAYSVVQIEPAPPDGPANARDYSCFSSYARTGGAAGEAPLTSRPLRDEPDSAQDRQITGFGNDGTPIAPVFALTSDVGTNPFRVPRSELTDPLFRGADDPLGPGIGFQKILLYSPSIFSFDKTVHDGSRCPYG